MGNRGRLHDGAGRIGRRWQGKAWITCTLREKPRRGSAGVLPPNGYTRLFFLDEAVACAAGHRPCAECRRAVYNDFRAAWGRAFGQTASAAEMDRVLHTARIDAATRGQRHHAAQAESLPFGAFILHEGVPHLVTDDALYPYSPDGYGAPLKRPAKMVTVLTPAPLVDVMRAGWRPLLDPAQDRPNW